MKRLLVILVALLCCGCSYYRTNNSYFIFVDNGSTFEALVEAQVDKTKKDTQSTDVSPTISPTLDVTP